MTNSEPTDNTDEPEGNHHINDDIQEFEYAHPGSEFLNKDDDEKTFDYNDNYIHPDYFEDDSQEFAGDQKKMGLGDHLEELRGCFFKCIIMVFIVGIGTAVFYKEIFDFLLAPVVIAMKGEVLNTKISETFTVLLKCIVLTSIAISLPLIIREGWNFVKPGLKLKEQNLLVSLMTVGTLFFFCGMLMAYCFVVPITVNFFIDLNNKLGMENEFFVGDSLSMVVNILLVFGIAFETPLIVMGLIRSGIAEIDTLKGLRKYVLFGAVLAGGILTPPDPMSQVMLGGTLYGLFEVGLILGKMGFGTSKKADR